MSLGEFDIIARYFANHDHRADVLLGVGDDAAVLYVGDEVTLVSPLGDLGPMGVMPRTKKFRVAAIFYSGMYEYDASHVYTTMQSAQEYFGFQGKASVIDVKVDSTTTAATFRPPSHSIHRASTRRDSWDRQ